MNATDGDRFGLEIPPSPQYVGAVRLFAAALARHFGCDQEVVEDVKIAISEVCTSAIMGRPGRDGRVRVSATIDGERLTFEMDDVPAGPPDAEMGAEMTETSAPTPSLELVRALFPDAEISGGIRFSVDIPAAD